MSSVLKRTKQFRSWYLKGLAPTSIIMLFLLMSTWWRGPQSYAEVTVKDAKVKQVESPEQSEKVDQNVDKVDLKEDQTSQNKKPSFVSMDRNRSRYFAAPSNLSLKSGESYFSQGIASTYGRGLSDDLTLHLRFSSLVFFFYPIFVSSIQYSFDYTDDLRGGVGLAMMPWDGLITYVYKSISYGNEDAHVTLSFGQPANIEEGRIQFTRFLVSSLGSNIKLSKSVRFITESWLLCMLNSQYSPIELLYSAGFRFQGEQFAFDVGSFGIYDSGRLFTGPWLELTWNFE